MIKWIKDNSLAISILSIIAGSAMLFFSNEYSITSKTISTAIAGSVKESIIYTLDRNMLLLSILSNIFLSLGLAIFISTFFIKHIESNERDKFEERILSFQRPESVNS